jgi:hypothetical protein
MSAASFTLLCSHCYCYRHLLLLLHAQQQLVINITLGRDMSGFHFRSDGYHGCQFGEAIATAYLQEQLDQNPECEGQFSFSNFAGERVVLTPSADCKAKHSIQ